MDGYELIMRIQQKIQEDPNFAARFNELGQKLNSKPGLEQEVMRIIQISDEKKRKKAIDKLTSSAKRAVSDFMKLINE